MLCTRQILDKRAQLIANWVISFVRPLPLLQHFQNFADQYESKFAIIYGRFLLERITKGRVFLRRKAPGKNRSLYLYVEAQLSLDLDPDRPQPYRQRGTNVLQTIFKQHFQKFADTYEQDYAPTYGRFRLERITEVVENFISCGLGVPALYPGGCPTALR